MRGQGRGLLGQKGGCRVVSKPREPCEDHINHSQFLEGIVMKEKGSFGGLRLPVPVSALSFLLSTSPSPLSLSRPLCAEAFLDICPDLYTGKNETLKPPGVLPNKGLQRTSLCVCVCACMSVRERERER